MGRRRKESFAGILVSRITGIIVFLILLGVANIIAGAYSMTPAFLRVVGFFNTNVGLIVLISAIFLVSDLSDTFIFPLNLPGPVIGAFGTIFMVIFIFRLFALVGDMTGIGIFSIFTGTLAHQIYVLVFVAALIGGYVLLFMDPPGRA